MILNKKILLWAFVVFLLTQSPLNTTAEEAVPPKEILLGMSTALSGPTAPLGKNVRQGVQAGLERVNRQGGIHGLPLRLLALDDGYEPRRTAPNMRRLIQQENVLAVIGNVGTPTAIAAVPIANQQKTLMFAPFTGAGLLRKSPPDRYVINYRASYAEETAAMIDALIKIARLKPAEIALFTQRDTYGDAGYIGAITALKRYGLKDERSVMHVRYERNTLGVENALANILFLRSLPRAVIMVGAHAPCAKFIKLAREAGLNALFLNVSFVGSSSLARKLGETIHNVIVTQVVPHPLESSLPLVKDYHADLNALGSSTMPRFSSFEGYIAARIFIHAFKHMKVRPTRESIVDALEGLDTFDIGLGESLHLSPKEHQASHHVWPTILRDGKFVSFEWADIGKLVKQRGQ